MSDSEEEEDYMSDAFLNNLPKDDIRPGLLHSHAQKRKHEVHKKHKTLVEQQKMESPRVLESKKRDEGLNNAISSENKGFALLQKMGYKPGMSLGKSGSSGRTEPIPLEVKVNRGGLGREAQLKESRKRLQDLREKREQLLDPAEYRERMRSKVLERQHHADLIKCQRICEELDRKAGYVEPIESYFWVFKNQEEEDEDDDNEEEQYLEVWEKLEAVVSYLRETYVYCVWCATNYDDEKDLQENCPGFAKDEH